MVRQALVLDHWTARPTEALEKKQRWLRKHVVTAHQRVAKDRDRVWASVAVLLLPLRLLFLLLLLLPLLLLATDRDRVWRRSSGGE